MNLEDEVQRPASTNVGAGRWAIVAIIAFNFIPNLLGWPRHSETIPLPVVVVAQLGEVAACILLLWRPWLGLGLGLLPLGLTVAFGDMDADSIFCILASATVCFRAGPMMILPVALLGTGYGAVRCLFKPGLFPLLRDSVFIYSFSALLGILLGLLLRVFLRILNRGEAQLAVLAADVTEIRSGERLRLAGELRSAVSERLAQAWAGQRAPRHTSDAWILREALERVQAACLDAVTRVRALVGMLREDPVADGSDESLAVARPREVLARMAQTLRAQGLQVELELPGRLDESSPVTQLTISRVAQLLQDSSQALRPDPLRLKVTYPPGEVRMTGELVPSRKPRPEDTAALARIRERVQALGGSFSSVSTRRGSRLSFSLPESLITSQDSAAGDEPERSPWLRAVSVALPMLALFMMALWTYRTQPLDWPLAWAGLGYLSAAILYWQLLPGGILAIVSVTGMLLTPEQTPVALSAVLLMLCWKVTRLRNRYWSIIPGAFAIAGLWGSNLDGVTASLELRVGVLMMFVGLIGFTLIRQYQTVRSRQAERTSALVEAIDAARTEERNLLARELHDVLAHHLSVILLQCMAYGESDEADEVRLALDRIAKSLEGAEGELALLTSVMSEGEEGQMPALVRPTTVAKRLKSTLAGSNFPADFKIDQDADELPPITQRTITRAMQEGVTNIIRYAKPGGRCLVELHITQDTVRLCVRSKLSASKRGSKLSLGFGLAGIRERVDLSGGKFTAGPEEDDWVVTVELPHTESEAASVGGPSAYIH